MKKYKVRCPACGCLNENLYLDETEGWMECEKCKVVVQIFRHAPVGKIQFYRRDGLLKMTSVNR